MGVVRLLFPGDVPFIADEPLLIQGALDALESKEVAMAGLQGTRGAAYGAAPTWFYQAMLLLTSDLRIVALVKVVFVTLLTGYGLLLLGRSVPRLSTPLGAFAFLSPYLWFYARDLWDNSFAIPFTAMLVATYAAFHASKRTRWLVGTALFAVLCVMTHLMTTPLVGAVLVHLVWSQRRRLAHDRRFAFAAGGLGAAAAAALAPYLRTVSAGPATDLLWSPSPRALLFALDGFRIFTLRGFDYVIGDWTAAGFAPALVVISSVSYGVGAWGAVLLNRVLRQGDVWEAKGAADGKDAKETGDAEAAVAGVVALTLVFFVIVANGKRLVEHPHYYSGVWIAFFALWWWGMSDLVSRLWARRVLVCQAATMAAFLVGLAVWLHVNGGTRSLHYGPTLGNQMAVAAELDRLGVE
ncbi:MAG: glycosyltransferase family 39 protein, partial [Gemmatimonadetes bacterium]|nr:glycosyltransferase family 39 protein [Gemmatimonadota bacterium]